MFQVAGFGYARPRRGDPLVWNEADVEQDQVKVGLLVLLQL
jgi:hypothetical protein